MDFFEVILVYLHDLMHADVNICQGKVDRVEFNGAGDFGEFNSRLMTGEIMCTSFLAKWKMQARRNPELKQVVTDRFQQLNSLFICDEKSGWTHRFLRISKGGKSLHPDSISPEIKKSIDRYLYLQRDSFERQRQLLQFEPTRLEKDYRIKIGPTELIELALSLMASKRLECRSGHVTQTGAVRYIAALLGVEFPANFDSLMFQLRGREQTAKFIDELRKNLCLCLEKKK